jgi:hypothetical protein
LTVLHIQAKDITIHSTMWDGKSCTAIAKTFLPPSKKLSSSACHLCLANPADMNNPEVWERPIKLPEMLDYSCTVMHMWIRCMEYLFQLGIKLQQEGEPDAPFTSPSCQLAKRKIQVTYRYKYKTSIDTTKPILLDSLHTTAALYSESSNIGLVVYQ